MGEERRSYAERCGRQRPLPLGASGDRQAGAFARMSAGGACRMGEGRARAPRVHAPRVHASGAHARTHARGLRACARAHACGGRARARRAGEQRAAHAPERRSRRARRSRQKKCGAASGPRFHFRPTDRLGAQAVGSCCAQNSCATKGTQSAALHTNFCGDGSRRSA